jgi:integrase
VLKRDKAQDISLEEEALSRLIDLKRNRRKRFGPATLRGLRAEEEAKSAAETAKREAEARAMTILSDYWHQTYLPVAQRSKKASSWVKEQQHFERWINPIMGNMPLKTIRLPQFDELVKALAAAGLSPRSKEYITGTLRRILKHAYDRRIADESPPSGKRIGVTGPGNNRRLRVISPEEEAAIMAELELLDPHAWRITRFAFLTGCRASEAFTLVWANVDFARECITFPDTKNHDPRIIPVTPPLADLFASMQNGAPDQPVFPKLAGGPYTEAPSAFRTAVDKRGLNEGRGKRDRVVFHSIRHTVASRLARRLGPRDLMDIMGWRTVQMAMRYVHSNEDLKTKALAMLGALPQTGKVLEFQAQR